MPKDLQLIPNEYLSNKNLFEEEKQKLLHILSNFKLQIEHIGSTSIPETIGKGIIDILVMCGNKQDQRVIKNVLIKHGYIQGELSKIPDGRLFFTNVQGQTHAGDIHLHLITKDDLENQASLKFRDYMLKNPNEVQIYNKEKLRLARTTDNNRHEYATQKEAFIKRIMGKISG